MRAQRRVEMGSALTGPQEPREVLCVKRADLSRGTVADDVACQRQLPVLSANRMAYGIRSRISLALVSSRIRWRSTNRYSMSSGSFGNAARMLGGIVDKGRPSRYSALT